MATITDKPFPEKDDEELALIQSRHHHQEEPYILAEKEWQRRLIKESTRLSSRQTGFWIIVGAMVGAILSTTLPAIVSQLSKKLTNKPTISFQPQTKMALPVQNDQGAQDTHAKKPNIEKAK